ncbi:ATP-binding protein [Halomicronema hongdechloris]|nr:ATP-binding protein [Halomicronema hongdechloris]
MPPSDNHPIPLRVERGTPLSRVIHLICDSLNEAQALSPVWGGTAHLGEIGCVVVTDNTALAGIATALDIVCQLARGAAVATLAVDEVMTHPVITVGVDQPADPQTVLALCQTHGIHHLPVLDEQRQIVGLITSASVMQETAPTNWLKLQPVAARMVTAVPTAGLEASGLQLAQLMQQWRRSYVVILQSQEAETSRFLGIVTAVDVIRLHHQGICLEATSASALMSDPPLCLHPSDSLWFAYGEMKQQWSYLPVCNEAGHFLGLLTAMAMVEALDPAGLSSHPGQLRQTLRRVETDKVDLLQNRNSELERQVSRRTAQLQEQSQRMQEELRSSRLLAATALRIQRSLDLAEILEITVQEMRQLLQCDRTFIYRLQPSQTQTIEVESVADQALSIRSQSTDYQPYFQDLFQAYHPGEIQAIADLAEVDLPSSCTTVLEQLGVQANLVIPISKGNDLWGLLVAQHCANSRPWQSWEISLLKHLATQVSIAIQKSALYEQLQAELNERRLAEQALTQANEELEARVEDRTASLRQANEQMQAEIAERRRAEEALRQAKDQMQAVLDAVPGLVSWIDGNLNYLGVNQHLTKVFQVPGDEFLGQEIGFLNPGHEFGDVIRHLFHSPEPAISKEITVWIHQQPRTYLIAAQKYDHDQAAVCIGIDVTEHRQAEAALRKSEARFQQLVEQTNEWVWEIDRDLAFSYVNPKAEDLLGYAAGELVGHQFQDFMPEDAAIRFMTVLEHAVAKREPFDHLEQTVLHKDGHAMILESSGTPVFSADGVWQGYWGIARDITERKQIEHNIRKALTKERELSELKTRFISMASHEFRTPLTTIMASAESLEHYRHKWSEDKILTYLKRIQKTTQHMNGLLNDVLTVGKANAGKMECHPAPIALADFCHDLVTELNLGASPPDRLMLTYQGPATNVMADEKLLRQMLGNLLSNALKYSPADTQPYLDVTVQTDQIRFVVQDHGIGIPPDDLKRLFEPFHRASNVGNIAGTGLGLAIVKKSVDAHGGDIYVASEANVGTTFTITLPLDGAGTHHD